MKELEATRHPTLLLITYSAFYFVLFLLGLLGNTFAVLSVILHPQLRSSTDYLISSLAIADLLIILFCLPTTLLNNLLTGYYCTLFFICSYSIPYSFSFESFQCAFPTYLRKIWKIQNQIS